MGRFGWTWGVVGAVVACLVGGCQTATAAYDGIYSIGFEHSGFVAGPCQQRPAPRRAPADLRARVEAANGGPLDKDETAAFRIRFTGALSPPGRYGHPDADEREATVEQVLSVEPPAACTSS